MTQILNVIASTFIQFWISQAARKWEFYYQDLPSAYGNVCWFCVVKFV